MLYLTLLMDFLFCEVIIYIDNTFKENIIILILF